MTVAAVGLTIAHSSELGIGGTESPEEVFAGLMDHPLVEIAGLAGSTTSFIAVALVMGAASPVPIRERLRWMGPPATPSVWVAAICAVHAAGWLYESALRLLGFELTGSLEAFATLSRATGPVLFLALLLFGAVGAGAGEELLFRGYAQSRLETRWGRLPAILVTSAMFGLVHMDTQQSPVAFGMGLLLGWIAAAVGQIRVAVAAHVINNALSFVTYRFSAPEEWPPLVNGAIAAASCAVLAVGIGLIWRRRVHFQPRDMSASRIS